jgi:hypothetical protein
MNLQSCAVFHFMLNVGKCMYKAMTCVFKWFMNISESIIVHNLVPPA